MLVSSGSGKSSFVHRLLLKGNEMFDHFPDAVFYFYGVSQPAYDQLKSNIPQITFVEGFPSDFEDSVNPSQKTLVILDDLMSEMSKEGAIIRLFTKARHSGISVIFLTQDLFYSKQLRTVSINANFIVLFRSRRDRLQVMNLAKQMYPGETKFLVEAFDNATAQPYGYLLLDLRPTTPEEYRVRTNIFPGERQYAYVRREHKRN